MPRRTGHVAVPVKRFVVLHQGFLHGLDLGALGLPMVQWLALYDLMHLHVFM